MATKKYDAAITVGEYTNAQGERVGGPDAPPEDIPF